MLLAKKVFHFHVWVQKCHLGNIEKLPTNNYKSELGFVNFTILDTNLFLEWP